MINRRLPGRYVRSWAEFEFLPGVLDAFSLLPHYFGRIVVVTNQLGVHKELMSLQDLADIHQQMVLRIAAAGCKIDQVYACTDRSVCRKPQTGMAQQAKRDFPDIDFSRSVVVGDSVTDMQFGQALGMYTVLIPDKAEEYEAYQAITVDQRVRSLLHYAQGLLKEK